MDRESKRALFWSAQLSGLALAWRSWLSLRFWGHEEEDWANLIHSARISEALQSGTAFGAEFSELIDLEHMPLFTWLCAGLTLLVGDPRSAALMVAGTMGALSVGLVTWIGWRWLSPLAGLTAGLLLCFQPESALYAATPLRESTYAALMLAGVALIGERRGVAGGLTLSLAFLCRFNIAFSLLPALAGLGLWQLRKRQASEDQRDAQAALTGAALVTITVLAWVLYYQQHSEGGDWRFWAGVMDRNAGNAVTDLFPMERLQAIALAVFGLWGWIVPGHFGWLTALLALFALTRFGKLPRQGYSQGFWLLAAGLSTFALLTITALVSAYPPSHNLYWKWLCPSVPYLALLAGHGNAELVARLKSHTPQGSAPLIVAIALVFATTAPSYVHHTRSQLSLSDEYAGNQVRLARWVEQHWPAGAAIVGSDGEIAQLYLTGRGQGTRSLDWLRAAPADDPAALGRWLISERVALLLWFHEEWTGAREVAGFLAEAKQMELVPGLIVERIGQLERSDGAGFTAFQVLGPDPQFRPGQPAPLLTGGGGQQ